LPYLRLQVTASAQKGIIIFAHAQLFVRLPVLFFTGMYQSANYVLFVNYEDFQDDIRQLCAKSPAEDLHFFSGYDCDSLALEPVTGFAEQFLPFFAEIPNAWLELRTKSTQSEAC